MTPRPPEPVETYMAATARTPAVGIARRADTVRIAMHPRPIGTGHVWQVAVDRLLPGGKTATIARRTVSTERQALEVHGDAVDRYRRNGYRAVRPKVSQGEDA